MSYVPYHVWHILALVVVVVTVHYSPALKTEYNRRWAGSDPLLPPPATASLLGDCQLAEEAKGWPHTELFINKTSKDVCRPRDQHGANEHVRKMGVLEKKMREALRDAKAHATAACEYGIFSRVVMMQPTPGDFVFMMNPEIAKSDGLIACSSVDSIRGRQTTNRSRVIHVIYDHPVELADNLFAPKRAGVVFSDRIACSYQTVEDLMNHF